MDLNFQVIKAVSSLYSIEELETELKKAVTDFLQNPERIVSASTGAGASYTKALNLSPQELVELLSACVDFKKNGAISSGNNIFSIVSNI